MLQSLIRIKHIMLVLAFVACSTHPKITELDGTADPQTEIERLDADLLQAYAENVDVLSPDQFNAAQKQKTAAIEARTDNKDQKKILYKIALSRAYLEKAITTSNISREALKDPLQARSEALLAQSNKYFSKEMSSLDSKFKDISSEIEDNDTSSAVKDGTKLAESYRELELKSIKKDALGAAKQNIEQAENEGAKKLTPETLVSTQKIFSESEGAINNSRHNASVISASSKEATEASERLLKMVRTAKKSMTLKPEDFAKITEVNEQSLDQTQENLQDSQRQLANTAAQNSAMSSQVWLDEKYEMARGEFTPEEAEVFKQGDKILLRLKGLTFPKNNSTISTENFELLAKVQKVIGEVSPSQVTIEGHTDSLGGKKLNQKLSDSRAKSVQAYLVANNSVDMQNVSAAGYGYSKPIASNKTPKGRSQNRRVDVIIQAQ